MKKTTIQRRVARYFILMIAFIVLILSVLDFYENYLTRLDRGMEHVSTCSEIVENILGNHNLNEIERPQNIESYQNVRRVLRSLCKSFKFDYLYIYSIDSDTLRRRRLFNVAFDDETDSLIQKEHVPGGLSETLINATETAILKGARGLHYVEINNEWGHEITWYIPYTNEKDELLAIIGIDSNFEHAKKKFMERYLFAIIPMTLAMICLLILLIRMIAKRIVSPLRIISEKMLSFANDSEHNPEKLDISSNDEIGEIAESFDKMASDISKYISNIEELTKERVENNVQLEVARRIQYGLVPEKTEINDDSFSVCAVTKPAKAVGGDFYDCFQRADGTLCIMIGDVSGKGVSAAIFMAMTKTMIREKLMTGFSPAQALNYANDEMCSQNPENLFATAFVAVLNPKTREFCYSNAGHTPPVLLKDEPEFLEMDKGIALAMFEDSDLKDYTLRFPENQGILLYTDGLTEAIDMQNNFFGTERLIEVIKNAKLSKGKANDAVNVVLKAVHDFFKGKEQFDDTAVLAAYFTTT